MIVQGASGPALQVVAHRNHARLQIHQFGDVALQGGQTRNQVLGNGVAQLRVYGLQLRAGRRGDFHHLGIGAQFELYVERVAFVHFHLDVGNGRGTEARHLHRGLVSAGTNIAEGEVAGRVAALGLGGVGIQSHQFDRGSGHDGAGGIGNSADHGAGSGGLCE